MCGIAGVLGRRDETTVRAMLAVQTHRGPDDLHAVTLQGATLGAVRLSIVDLDGGRQPLSNEAGDVWAAQNGELYNFPDARRELEARGHRFASRCDTELLPHLYEDHGSRLPEHIDGMFAVSVWDERNQRGLLARDRTGKKPLYYTMHDGALYYASEIKSLLEIPGFERRMNPEALRCFLGFKHVPQPLSIFEGVHMLPPAHLLEYEPGREPVVRRYWDVSFTENPETARMTDDEIADRLLELLRAGVRRRLMADVPIGFFLSGGIDSSLSTVLAAEESSTPIKTFTLVYGPESTTPGKEADTRWARHIAEKYATDHHEERIEFTDFPENFRRILQSFDEPFSGVVSTYFLSRLISRHVKVAVSGDGADELFGSYLSHRLALPMANYERYRETGDPAHVRLFEDQPEFLARIHSPHDWEWRSRLLVFDDAAQRNLLHPDVGGGSEATSANLRGVFGNVRGTHPTSRILDAEFHSFFPDQVLAFTDRLSMAHSLEVRTAFLDTKFVEFAAGIPGRLRIRDGETKSILKRAAERHLPHEMVHRPKEGFVMPINTWLLNDLGEYVRDTLAPSRIAAHGLFQPEAVSALVDGFYAGANGTANKVLSLLAFQEWFDLYRPSVGGRSAAAA